MLGVLISTLLNNICWFQKFFKYAMLHLNYYFSLLNTNTRFHGNMIGMIHSNFILKPFIINLALHWYGAHQMKQTNHWCEQLFTVRNSFDLFHGI